MPRLDRPSLTAAVTGLLARRTPYLETELHTLPGLVGAGDVCVDVGSAAGLYSQALSHLVGPTGLVHSVEPLGAEPGRAVMKVPFRSFGPDTSRSFLAWKSHGLGSNAEFARHVDVAVDVETLDGLCGGFDRLDFVKIDVEGGELHVLHGGQRVIERFRPTMLIEIETRHTERYEYSVDDVVDWLACRGYAMFVWRNGWQAVDRVCSHANNYLVRAG